MTHATENKQKVYTVDATDRPFGRVAVEVATLLRGKREVGFAPHLDPKISVHVEHVSNIKFTGTKFQNKLYYRHSHYPGGLKTENLATRWKKNPKKVFFNAVAHMLPKNKLRKLMLKRLKISL